MKRLLILIVLSIAFISSYCQAPTLTSEKYKFVYSEDKYGNKKSVTGFPYISLTILTVNLGLGTESVAWYCYDSDGNWQQSAEYSWIGLKNGWYVYGSRAQSLGNYILISRDLKTVKIERSVKNGIARVYQYCN